MTLNSLIPGHILHLLFHVAHQLGTTTSISHSQHRLIDFNFDRSQDSFGFSFLSIALSSFLTLFCSSLGRKRYSGYSENLSLPSERKMSYVSSLHQMRAISLQVYLLIAHWN